MMKFEIDIERNLFFVIARFERSTLLIYLSDAQYDYTLRHWFQFILINQNRFKRHYCRKNNEERNNNLQLFSYFSSNNKNLFFFHKWNIR